MRNIHSFSALSPLLMAAAICGQLPVTITPAQGAAGLGNANNNIPFSWSPCAYQQVHSKGSFSSPGAVVVSKLRLRMASGFVNYTGYQVDLELFMAQSPNGGEAASSTFANNVTPTTEVNVLLRKMVSMPTVPDNSWAVAPFVFDTPFVWPGTHLSWRANVYGNSNGNAIFTYPLDAFSYGSAAATAIGTGCKANNGSAAATLTSSGGLLGGTLTWTGQSNIAAVGPAILTLGSSSTSWGALPLPIDLTPFGAPGCSINNDILVSFASTTTGTGSCALPLSVPADPALGGAVLFSQMAFLDAGANLFGMITTPGRRLVLPQFIGAARIYAIAAPPQTSGTVGAGFAMTIGFN